MAAKQSRQSSGIGGSLILIIFIVLTVTVFSVLTLVSAQNELGTVSKSAQISSDYYEAEKQAALKCGELNASLSGLTDDQEIVSLAVSAGAEASSEDDGVTVSFSVAIDDNRELVTVLTVKDGALCITSQKIAAINEIVIDESINVWDGSSIIIE